MTQLRALFHFDVGELWVRWDELGSAFDVDETGSVRLALPGGETAFVLAENRFGERETPFTGSSIGRRLELEPEMVGVRIIQVAVDFDGDIRASDFDEPTQAAYSTGNEAWEAAEAIAEDVLRRFMSWARVVGNQYRIALSTDAPASAGISVLYDVEAETRIPLVDLPSRSRLTSIRPCCARWRRSAEWSKRCPKAARRRRRKHSSRTPVQSTGRRSRVRITSARFS